MILVSRLTHGTAPNSVDNSDREDIPSAEPELKKQNSFKYHRRSPINVAEMLDTNPFNELTRKEPIVFEVNEHQEQNENSLTNEIVVHTDNELGLPPSTDVKINISRNTTVKQVLQQILKQINVITKLKGLTGPIVGQNNLENFSLIAEFGNERKVLKNDAYLESILKEYKNANIFIKHKDL